MNLFTFLLLVHIAGAIIGFGPTFAFAVLGPLAAKKRGPEGLALLDGIVAIQRRLVIPVAAFVQPVSGVWLIFEGNWDENFFSHEWLWTALVLYAIAFYSAIFIQRPRIEKMISLARGGGAGSAEFVSVAQKVRKLGPAVTLMLLAIIFLMVVKPG